MKNLIAFTGLAGSGKTTAAFLVASQFRFVRMSFADPIRDMLESLGVTRQNMQERKNEPLRHMGGKTPRELMQTLGTEWGRSLVTPDIWITQAARKISRAGEFSFPGVVFDDCRFDNEAKMIRERGGVVIRIIREGTVKLKHESEAGVSEEYISTTILNPLSRPEHLEPALKTVLECL